MWRDVDYATWLLMAALVAFAIVAIFYPETFVPVGIWDR